MRPLDNNLVVPETWETIEDFAWWFKKNGYPCKLPDDGRVRKTDGTYSFVVFKHDKYQAELYMMERNFEVPRHTHQEMDQVIIHVGGTVDTCTEKQKGTYRPKHSGKISSVVRAGDWHSLRTHENGAILYVLQKWLSREKLTSATIAYEGPSLGPVHEALRKEERP